MTPDEVEITDVRARARYEARLAPVRGAGSRSVAVVAYERRDGAIAFLHTVVPHDMAGLGVGSALARRVLDDARKAGESVIPRCPFIAAYIRRHPAYRDLVPDALRKELLDAPRDESHAAH